MHHFDIDWADFLDRLAAWDQIPRAARLVATEQLKPSQPLIEARLGAAAAVLRSAGFIEPAGGKSVAVAPPYRAMWRALRAMERHQIFDTPEPARVAAASRYIGDHFTAAEVADLLDANAPGYQRWYSYGAAGHAELARLATASDWLEAFVDAKQPAELAAWVRRRQIEPPSARTDAALIALVDALVRHPEGCPLRELPALVPKVDRRTVGKALHLGLRALIFWASLRGADSEPMIGIWPATARWLGRPPAAPPRPVAAQQTYHAAFTMEDMTAMLAEVAAEPPRLRGNDYGLFERSRQALTSRFAAAPAWALTWGTWGGIDRLNMARDALDALHFVEMSGVSGKDLRLVATPAGLRWLGLPSADRLKAVLDHLVTQPRLEAQSRHFVSELLPFLPVTLSFPVPPKLDLRRWLREAFESAAKAATGDEFVPVAAFIAYHARERNPFMGLTPADLQPARSSFQGRFSRADREQMWETIVLAFLQFRLLPFGGARMARPANGELAFQVTDIGRYLLGAASSFAYEADADARIVVQPNFDIVFLAPAPKAEAELARVAERAGGGAGASAGAVGRGGNGVGALFKLTRVSVLRAAETGATAAQLLGLLRALSSTPVPENVERQIEGWLEGVRRVSVRPAALVECADADTARRVLAAAGPRVRRVSDTVLEVVDGSAKGRTALVKKLRSEGVFVA